MGGSPISTPGWYPDPSGLPGRRYWDGYQWAPPPPPARKTSALKIIGIVIAASVGIFLVLGVIGAIAGTSTMPSPTPTSRAVVAPTMPPSFTPPTFAPPVTLTPTQQPAVAIGQPATDGQMVFTVTSVDQSKIAGVPSNQFMQVTAQGQFLNVHITVVNTGNQPETFLAGNQKLKLGDSTYEPNSSAALWNQAMNVSINPGNSIQTVLSFDVPTGTDLSGTLQLHQSLFSPGVEVAVS